MQPPPLPPAPAGHKPNHPPVRAAHNAEMIRREPISNAREFWRVLRQGVESFVDDDLQSKGASIAFYAVTSIAPSLVIVIAIASLAFSNSAAEGAVTDQLSGVIGSQSAEFLQMVILNAAGKSSGIIATILGVLSLLATASGLFSEIKSALNIIWKTPQRGGALERFFATRFASLGLVASIGFLLLTSLVIGSVMTAVAPYIDSYVPFGKFLLTMVNFVVSFLLGSVLFAAIFKILPDAAIEWRDVIVGAVATAFLFEIGKLLVGLYLGSSAVGSSYGAAGGLIVLQLWIYCSAQIFLLGAAFTKAYADSTDRRSRARAARLEGGQ